MLEMMPSIQNLEPLNLALLQNLCHPFGCKTDTELKSTSERSGSAAELAAITWHTSPISEKPASENPVSEDHCAMTMEVLRELLAEAINKVTERLYFISFQCLYDTAGILCAIVIPASAYKGLRKVNRIIFKYSSMSTPSFYTKG